MASAELRGREAGDVGRGETPRTVEQDRKPGVYPSDAWSHIEEFQAANNVMTFGF